MVCGYLGQGYDGLSLSPILGCHEEGGWQATSLGGVRWDLLSLTRGGTNDAVLQWHFGSSSGGNKHIPHRAVSRALVSPKIHTQSYKATGQRRGKGPNRPAANQHSESGKSIHTCKGRTSYSVDQGQSALGIS